MKVYETIKELIKNQGALLCVLIDPDDVGYDKAADVASSVVRAGADLIFVGGTVGVEGELLDATVKAIKKAVPKTPVLLFPGNISGVSKEADAVLFLSLLNSRNTYYITGVQALAAPVVAAMGIEAISTAYLIIEPGQETAAGWVSDARPLPQRKPKLTAAYALAAKILGFKAIYLEAGSGAAYPVSDEIVAYTKKACPEIPIIVGGGIRDAKTAAQKVKAGADIIVIGTALEATTDVSEKTKAFAQAIKAAKK